MKWYYQNIGEHTHVRVYYNGALCGTLIFRTYEFEAITADCPYEMRAEIIEGAKHD